jgi:hypothetical protein
VILGSILPGVRQLRAPLAAGYLWILFIFLLAHLGSGRPHSDLTQDLDRLGHALSPAGLAVAVSFAAYLIGSFSQGLSQGVSRRIGNRIGLYESGRLTWRGLEGLEDLLVPRVVAGALASPVEARDLSNEIIDEIDLVKSRLLEIEQDLHNEVDRLHAEADFIAAVLAPLIAVGIFAVLQIPTESISSFVGDKGGGGFLLVIGVLLAAYAMARQGLGIYQRANDKIIDAIFLEQVSSPALDRWDREAGSRA